MTNPTKINQNPAVASSSPACSMHEADDAYMGYADKNELIIFLNELLEAERAGARVTLESARAAGDGPIAELMRTIQPRHRDLLHGRGIQTQLAKRRTPHGSGLGRTR